MGFGEHGAETGVESAGQSTRSPPPSSTTGAQFGINLGVGNTSGPLFANVIGNFVTSGPSSMTSRRGILVEPSLNPQSKIFLQGNLGTDAAGGPIGHSVGDARARRRPPVRGCGGTAS